MNVSKRFMFFVSIAGVFPASGSAWADDPLSAAGVFRDSAQAVYQGGTDLCSDTCGPELAGPLQDLGTSIAQLNAAIASGSIQQIQGAVSNTASVISAICTALQVSCPAPPFGALTAETKGKGETESRPAAPVECARQCDLDWQDCDRTAFTTLNTCVNRINEFLSCRLETPFCGYGGPPFVSSIYASA